MNNALAGGFDPVRRWTRSVRERLNHARPSRRRLSIKVTLGSASLALLASCAGPKPAPWLAFALLSAVLAHELPHTLWTRFSGRATRLTLDVWGARTEAKGVETSLGAQLGLALLGSALSLLLGYTCLLAASAVSSASLSGFLTQAGRLHLWWGALQLLPFSPFKLGALLSARLQGWLRVRHAFTSFAFGLTVLGTCVGKLGSPLVLVGFALWLSRCGRDFWQSVEAARDQHLDADQRLLEVETLILSDEPRSAMRLAEELLNSARSGQLRGRAGRSLAWAAIGAGDAERARECLSELPDGAIDVHLLAAYLSICHRTAEAIDLLEDARQNGQRARETSRLLVDLYFVNNQRDAVERLATADRGLLTEGDQARIRAALADPRPRADAAQS